jgi:hypothetical protein
MGGPPGRAWTARIPDRATPPRKGLDMMSIDTAEAETARDEQRFAAQ